ncbi:tetratricopeptide repeat protein [Yunchengibacter salinarum]|uniref:tetratricopeptide repeat protein n=1 Tax=Yunchengibacter salinarum TaxID=3133399 RepID=UPI0035B5C1C2
MVMCRLIAASLALVALAGCATGPERRVNTDAGPVSAKARNRLASEDPAALARVARGFERAGDLKNAHALYQQALAAAPGLVAARAGLARLTILSGNANEGLARLRELARESGDTSVWCDLIDALVMLGRFDAAFDAMKAANTVGLSLSASQQARLTAAAGDLDAARARLRQADGTKDNAAALTMALIEALDGHYDVAVRSLQAPLNTARLKTRALRALALVYGLSDQPAVANKLANEGLTLQDAQEVKRLVSLLPRLDPRERAGLVLFNRLSREAARRLHGTDKE